MLPETILDVSNQQILEVAWVPERRDMDWDDAAVTAIAWTEDRCEQEDATGLLLVEAHAQDFQSGPLGRFGRQHDVTTVRSAGRVRGTGPVLAYVPSISALERAMWLARRSSLCVVEGLSTSALGWAVEMGAIDLLTGERTLDVRTDQQKHLLERLSFYKNNGWGDYLGKQLAPGMLRDLGSSGLDVDYVVGDMLARGASERGCKKLLHFAGRR